MVRLDEHGEPEVVAARWGLIPPWWQQPKLPTLTFNARSEEAAEKPMWRQALRAQRCLMLAMGWYEWREQQGYKQPYFIHDADNRLLAIAGIWEEWAAVDGQDITSCALLTKSAAPAIARIHHRMPVILAPEQWILWLSPWTASNDIQAMIANARQDFSGHAVNKRVNDTRNDDAGLLERV